MKIKSPELSIPNDNPFSDDVLDRKQSAEVLTQLLSTIDEPFVLAIDSIWGTGKSTFLEMWLKHLRSEGYPCLNFNAWENDFSDDPLVSLIGEFELGFDNIVLDSTKKKTAKKHLLKAKKLGTTLIKRSLPAAIKIATAGVIDADKISEDVLIKLTEKLADDIIDKYEKDKCTIQDFKKRLRDFAKELSETEVGTKPLIIFIDELDRCRPTYALELLEKAKHFFNVEGIIFVLAIDKEQIGHSIRTVYGFGMDVDGYLRRFIDLDYHLPEPSSETFCHALFNKFGFNAYFSNRPTHNAEYEKKDFLRCFSILAKAFGLSLRVQEQCFSRLSIVLRTTPPNSKLHPAFLGALIALKAANPGLYSDYVRRRCNAKEVLKYIREASDNTPLESNYDTALEAYFTFGPCDIREINPLHEEYQRKANDQTLSDTQRDRAREVIHFFESFSMNYGMLDRLVNKIEVADSFT